MLSLQLFGGLRATLHGEPLAGRAAHRKRLGLLALLGIAPTRALSRDRLTVLLWPEFDPERSRHQLATAVYDLRKVGGEDLILAVGDDLRLNPARAGCDVWDFDSALENGEMERAARCCVGPLLDGFFLPDAPEFERWAEAERSRLAGLHARALERLATDAEAKRDFTEAARWWRSLAAQDPFSARIAVGLMNAFAASGDAASAIQHAGVHAALLREELGVAPNPEVVALADRLRKDPPVPTRPAPESQSVPAPPDLSDSGTSGDPDPAPREPALPAAGGAVGETAAPAAWPLARRASGTGVGRARAASVLGIGALLLAVTLSFFSGGGAATPATEPPLLQTLAVLPLKNDTGDPEQEHFADAMTEALIAELARNGSLRVISRTSVMPFKDPAGRKLPDIARELNADAIIEGSVFRDGDRVRITAQLIRASTDDHVWAESYEGTVRDIFALQGRVARAVAEQVGIRVAAQRTDPQMQNVGPVHMEAYEAYLRGRQLSGARSIAALREAIQLDPQFAPAYAALADRLALQGFFGFLPPDSAFEGARRAALQALTRNDQLAEAHGALGIVLLHYDWDWAQAERHFQRALELNPSNAYLRHMFAHQLLAHGQTAESARQSMLAAETDPFNAGLMACSGWHGLADGRHEHAASESLRALRTKPEFFWPEMILGWAYEQQGRYPEALASFRDAVSHSGGSSFALAAQAHAHAVTGEERQARDILAELHRRAATQYVSAYEIAAVYAGLQERDEALHWLERAYDERSSFLINLGWEPRFRGLRSDPRFQDLSKKLRLPAPLRTT